MAEYIDRTQLEPDTEWSDYYDDFISYSQSQINSLPQADVIERVKIDKAIEEIEALKKYEMERFSEDVMYHKALKRCLEIIKRNMGE